MAHMDAGKSGSCPKQCGARTVSVVMRMGPAAKIPDEKRVDPFSIFGKLKG